MLTVPAFAQSAPERSGVNSTLGISPSTQDFVTEAANSDMFEIESSKLAQQRSDDKTKQFAAKMVKDHTETSTELKSFVQGREGQGHFAYGDGQRTHVQARQTKG